MFIIQAVISAGLLYLAASGGFLPGKFMTLLAVLIVVLLVITFLLTQSRKSPVRIIGIVLAIIISGVLLKGAVYIYQILNTLDQVSEEKAQVSGYVVFVASDNSALTIEETSGYRIGILSDMDTDLTEKICTEIGTANGDTEGSSSPLHTESFESPVAMAQALLDGEIDAGVLNEAYTDILDEVVEDYSSKTRVIYEMEFQTNTYGNAETSDTSTTAGEKNSENEASGKIMDNSLIEDAFTVLISGIDVRGSISKTSRSDVNILMTVNPKTHRILLTVEPAVYFLGYLHYLLFLQSLAYLNEFRSISTLNGFVHITRIRQSHDDVPACFLCKHLEGLGLFHLFCQSGGVVPVGHAQQ